LEHQALAVLKQTGGVLACDAYKVRLAGSLMDQFGQCRGDADQFVNPGAPAITLLALAAALRLVQGDVSLRIEPQALALLRVGAIRGFAVGTQGAQQALGQYAN